MKAQTKEAAIAILKACEGYEDIELTEDESGTLCGTHANGLPVRIVGTDDAGWFEVHGGICKIWLDKGGAAGELGLPFSNEERDSDYRDPNGKCSRFQHGTIHGWPTDPNNPEGAWSFEVELTSAIPVMSLSPKTKARLEKLDREIESFRRLSEEYGEGNPLEKPLSEIERIRRAFDSKTFFMVTFGMLKAGKSTLVNTFVGREICPVGRSKETTLQSSIILAADEQHGEGIYIYSPKKDYSPEKPSEENPSGEENWTADAKESLSNDNKWKSEHCRKLMEYLGGTLLEEELAETFKVDFIPLSEGALETILTSDPIRFPGDANETRPNAMPPVVRIDRLKVKDAGGVATLLQSGVAILDTPGLDGARANATNDPFWDVLPAYGDYYLLVQSSMSAINKTCLDIVKKVCGATRDMPVLVVFNEMAADFWLKPDAEKAKLRADADEALKELSGQLRTVLGSKLPESIAINAGEASDAVFGSDDVNGPFSKKTSEMTDESRIRKLRDRIVETLMTRRGEIKEQNATNRLLKGLNNQEANLLKVKEWIDKERKEEVQEFTEKYADFERARDEIQSAFEKDGEGVRLAKAIGTRMESRLKEVFSESIFNGLHGCEYRKYKMGSANKEDETYRKGPDEAAHLAKDVEKVASAFEGDVKKQFADGDLGIGVDGAFKDKWESLEKDRNCLTEKVSSLTKSDGGLIREEAEDRVFPKSLTQNFDIESILLAVGEAKKNIDIPKIPPVNWALFRNRTYGSDSVYECKCFDAFETLLERMKNVFPDKAANLVGKALEDAIREKGRAYAKRLAERVNVALKKMEEENGNRQATFQRRIENLDEAERTLERMKKIFQEG